MKWVKVAISFLIAVMVIPTIILAVKDNTNLKETRTVNFTLLERNGNTYDITSGTFDKLLNNKFIINYDIKSSYPLVTQEDLEIANYYISEELKNEFIDRETNPRINIVVGKDEVGNYYELPVKNPKSKVIEASDLQSITHHDDVSIVVTRVFDDYIGGNAAAQDDNFVLETYPELSGDDTLYDDLLNIGKSYSRPDKMFRIIIPKNKYANVVELVNDPNNGIIGKTLTYELAQPRLAELYDLKTFKLYYDTSSVKVKFDVNDNDYLWEIYYTDHLQTVRGEHEVGNTWTVNFYVYDIQQSYIRNLILLIPLIYTAGLLFYLTNTFKRE